MNAWQYALAWMNGALKGLRAGQNREARDLVDFFAVNFLSLLNERLIHIENGASIRRVVEGDGLLVTITVERPSKLK